jgi:hypothetical protein
MHYKSLLLLAPVFITAVYAAAPAPTPGILNFPQAGFSIAPYDAPPGDGTVIALTMTPSSTAKNQSNVNVMIQPYNKSIKEYITLSKSQFSQFKFTIIAEKNPNDNEWVVEYEGAMQGQQFHWYAKAVSANNHVYLVTGTMTESQWVEGSEKIKKSVDSFKIIEETIQQPK